MPDKYFFDTNLRIYMFLASLEDGVKKFSEFYFERMLFAARRARR